MTKLIQKICNIITERYQSDKNVLGILLFGSAARNVFDKYSDIDIYILLNRKKKFSRENFIRNGIRIDVILETVADAKKYLKEDKNKVRRITSHMLAHGVILFQKNNELAKLQKIAFDNLDLKTKYTKDEILMHKYSIDDFWGETQRDIKNKDFIAFGIDSNLLINNVIELMLKLKGAYLPQPNLVANILNKVDKKAATQIINFYKENNYQNKVRILRTLLKHVYKKSGGDLPDNWSIK